MTRVLRTRAELRAALADAQRPVGLVPTMGWLHDGHRALIRRARETDATTVVSIFVNPRQFNDDADFTRYPRNEARDVARCASMRAWTSSGRRRSTRSTCRASTPRLGRRGRATARGCRAAGPLRRRRHGGGGALRPGGRRARLLRAEGRAAGHGRAAHGRPTWPCRPRWSRCPTVRDPDGLAMSSRNAHLSPAERAAAPVVHRALIAARQRWEAGETVRRGRSATAMRRRCCRGAARRTSSTSAARTPRRFHELESVTGPALLSMAVCFGDTRLIDNEELLPT